MAESVWIPAKDGRLGYLYKLGAGSNRLPIMMLHGWSGDEKVMWVLETTLPQGSTIVSPQAPLALSAGGYQWIHSRDALNSQMEDYLSAVLSLTATLEDLQRRFDTPPSEWILMGFSQGAAVALAYAATTTLAQPAGLVVLAGFVPQGQLNGLRNVPVYWGHGTQDELIPIEIAHRDLERLRQAGIDISFCEADVGHKVGVECTRGLKTWFEDHFPVAGRSN